MEKQLKNIKFVTIDNGCYCDHLGLCELEVDIYEPTESPAVLYNKILDESTGYVGIIHSDVTCRGLVESINETIKLHGFHGALGTVGAGSIWGKVDKYSFSPTCDSCFILVDADRSERFDSERFNSYHLFVEDYCVQVGGVGVIRINGYTGGEKFRNEPRFFAHHSYTLSKQGCAWGDYNKYKRILNKKWGKTIPTT